MVSRSVSICLPLSSTFPLELGDRMERLFAVLATCCAALLPSAALGLCCSGHLPGLWATPALFAPLPVRPLQLAPVEPGSQVPGRESTCFLPDHLVRLPTLRCEGGWRTWTLSELGSMDTRNIPGFGHYKKRTLKRAFARALRCGGAWYKNEWISSPLVATEVSPLATWQPRPRSTVPKGRRIKLFNWNVRALTTELWAELQGYLQCQGFDIAILQSTGWSFESTWTSAGYNILHCGDPAEVHGGVMILISTKLGAAANISYSTILPGRLLHVRVQHQLANLDILACYQHPWRATLTPEGNLEARGRVWTALHECLTSLPFRNRLILAGDFNSSLITDTCMDHHELKRIVKHHHLESLHSSTPQVNTYYSPQGNTQIDYVFGRHCQLDAVARRGIVDVHSPLASWREALDHRPMICQMPQAWQPWRRKPPPVIAQQKLRDHLNQLKRQTPASWQHLCDHIAQELEELPPQPDALSTIDAIALKHASKDLLAPTRPASGLATGGLKQMWMQHRALLRSKPATPAHIFQKWQIWTKIQEATQAYHHRDPYRMFKVVRDLAPKTPYKPVHLRNEYGLAQDPSQELDAIAAFFADLCQGGSWSFQAPSIDSLPFSCEDLEHSLACTPSTKSVAPGSCPGVLVKSLAAQLAPWLFELLTEAWTKGPCLFIPPTWRNAWVVCVPKRSIKAPKDIRPIALQCPIGKAILRTIVKRAQEACTSALVVWPVYAYLRGRSTEQALLRVHQHFRSTRERCKTLNTTIWTRHAGRTQPRCHGGITLSLDLSNAFDTVDRTDIALGMQRVNLPQSLQYLLLGWLDHAQYFISHKGLRQAIDVTRGIRQGCVASPFLWLMWTAEFLSRLTERTSLAWVSQHLSMYADDIISQWDFDTLQGLEQAITEIAQLLDLLEEMHLTVSLGKSAVLLKVTGTARKEILKKHTTRRDGITCLIVPRKDGRLSFLPIARQHKYLGTMLSYANPEDATLQFRIKSGQTAFFRLIKFLGKTHKLPLKMKLQLWTQCVLCSYLYGLYAAGITAQGCTRLSTRILLDLRRLTGCWAHLTHVSNSELCQHLKIREPIDELQVRWHDHITKHVADRQKLDPTDFLLNFDEHEHWQTMQDELTYWYHRQSITPVPSVQQWSCPYCPEIFRHRQSMRAHISRQHSELDTPHSYQPLRDSLHGLPQCRHCQLKLSTRNMLRQHIERQWCYAFDPDAQVQQPLCQRDSTRDLLRQRDWPALLADRELCLSLVHNCGICQHWCSQTNSLAAHLKKQHGEHYNPSLGLRPAVSALLRREQGQCPTCDQAIQQQHTCPVVMQLAMLSHREETLGASPAAAETADHGTPSSSQERSKRKSPFDGPYAELPADKILLFDAARDCYQGLNHCRHCSQTFGDHIGMRRHIERGRCTHFQESRGPQPWVLQFQAPLQAVMQSLHPEQWFCERELLLRLQRECALCGRRFHRSETLHEHLRQDHRGLVLQAQTYTQHLKDYYQSLGEVCFCGTWPHHGYNHECTVATQLGILRTLRQQAPERPRHAMVPDLIDRWLLDGDHERVLQHPEYSFLFGGYCSLCLDAQPTLAQPGITWKSFIPPCCQWVSNSLTE